MQRSINENPDGLGIVLGNRKGSQKIIKVCNPYCGPCASAHLPIEELLDNNSDLQVQILFTASGNIDDARTPPVQHLLAIDEKNDPQLIRQALDDWYLADTKNYEVFSKKYPMNGELDLQDTKIKKMATWCTNIGIKYTPTFFTNGNELPAIYNVADLKYFLAERSQN